MKDFIRNIFYNNLKKSSLYFTYQYSKRMAIIITPTAVNRCASKTSPCALNLRSQ